MPYRRLLLLVSLLLLWSYALHAAPISYEQTGPRMAVARVKNWLHGYLQAPFYSGSGTLVGVSGGRGLVLTAGHLFEDKVGAITVEFADGEARGGTLLAVDHTLDVAAIWINAPNDVSPVPLAASDPGLGEQLEIWGYGPRRFRSFAATVSTPTYVDGEEQQSLIGAQGVENRMVTVPGDSGGPMVRDGKLVGVHWGYRGADNDPTRCVHAVSCIKLRAWLTSRLGDSVSRLAFGS